MIWLDHLLALILVAGLKMHAAWASRRLRRQIDAGKPDARTRAYARTIVQQWALTIVLLAGWRQAARSFADLGLAAPTAGITPFGSSSSGSLGSPSLASGMLGSSTA